MNDSMKKLAAAMIIGMAAICPVRAETPAPAAVRLPDPVTFVTQMELGDLELAARWLDGGLPPDFMGSRIGSGLMIGAWEGNLELMRLFISRGADINRLNANGESALALAALRGKLDAARWLIERGARINPPPRQWSPLHYAVFAGQQAMVDYLLGEGADINATSTNGSSVLMMAIYEGRGTLARQLIERGADRELRNDWGDGALEWAMRSNNLEIARMVSNPEEFNIAVSQPREKWGAAPRSLPMSKELENLLAMRTRLVERNQSTDSIDRRIAAERVRIVRETFDRPGPSRAVTLEVSASRSKAGDQSVRVLNGSGGKGYPVPAATFTGRAKMPPKGPVKNY